MAEENKDQEKTEEPTGKRRQEARSKGQVAKSREMVSVAVLGACLIYFYFGAPGLFSGIVGLLRSSLGKAVQAGLTADSASALIAELVFQAFLLLIPLLLVAFLAALLINILQVGFLLSPESLAPRFSKIDPIRGMQRLFSLRSLVELVKTALKMVIVGTVAYWTIRGESERLLPLMEQSVQQTISYIGGVSFRILVMTCWVLVALAALDYGYQRWEYRKNLRMSRHEVKEENKQSEGDPLIKGRIRKLQREMARRRMMAAVPKADVVITNPTHLAVAIRYESETMKAPVVVAKGADHLAEKIRRIATQSGIPLVENKPVAQVLYKMVAVEQAIPEELYKAVAEILAYVYSLKQKRLVV